MTVFSSFSTGRSFATPSSRQSFLPWRSRPAHSIWKSNLASSWRLFFRLYNNFLTAVPNERQNLWSICLPVSCSPSIALGWSAGEGVMLPFKSPSCARSVSGTLCSKFRQTAHLNGFKTARCGDFKALFKRTFSDVFLDAFMVFTDVLAKTHIHIYVCARDNMHLHL